MEKIMMESPMVSIIIPVYNGSNYLLEAINSALNQDYCNFEIIVVNDGSKDNGKTEEIALSFGDKIRYLKKENGGVATALNLGIKKMKGEYFSWLSHDDIYYSNKLSVQIDELKAHGDMKAIVYSNYDVWEMNRGTINGTHFDRIYSNDQLTNSIFPILQWLTISCTPLVHKSHFDRVGYFDETLRTAQDNDMWFRLFRYGKNIFVSKSLMKSRIHNESGTSTIGGFNEELGEVAVKSTLALSETEIRDVYFEPAILYHRMAMVLKGFNIPHYYDIVMEKYQATKVPDNMKYILQEFQDYIDKISDGKVKRICIFGAGLYGKRLFHDLNSRLIYVEYFVDNNSELWGETIEGKLCISPIEASKIKDECLIIVAAQSPDGMLEQLKKAGFLYITTKQALEFKISQTVPLKWISALDNIIDMKDLTQEVELVKNKLRQAIFDICKNYNQEKSDSIVQR